jgi:mono/diheme cytochrome c family protein
MKTVLGYVVVALLAGLVPFGLIALARSQPSSQPPVHPIQDMFRQQKFRPQRGNPMYADGRAMRPRLPGVSARTDLQVDNEMVNDPENPHMIDHRDAPLRLDDDLTYQRVVEGTEPQAKALSSPSRRGAAAEGGYVKQIPVVELFERDRPAGKMDAKARMELSMDLLQRGRERYTIYCAVCHGQAGDGKGIVALRAAELQALGNANGWVAPKDYHTDDMRQQPVGKLYNTISNGARSMPAYAKQISVLDRWAIVAYVKALQRSQHPSDK